MGLISRASSLFDRPSTVEELRLIAWHHMINDSFLSTYTMVGSKEVRSFVNPTLALRRSLIALARNAEKIQHQIVSHFVPSFESMTKAMQKFGNDLEQACLGASLTEGDGV